MFSNKQPKLTRDCAAVLVPWGQQVTLPKGKRVVITQQSGGSFTVKYADNLYRIDSKDADALGKKVPSMPATAAAGEATRVTVEKSVWEQLATCYDPEIPINIMPWA